MPEALHGSSNVLRIAQYGQPVKGHFLATGLKPQENQDMPYSRVQSTDDIIQAIKVLIGSTTNIQVEERETESDFSVWFGRDGLSSHALGVNIQKDKYPKEFRYNAYVALMHNLTIMMANYTNFLLWVIDLKLPELKEEKNGK